MWVGSKPKPEGSVRPLAKTMGKALHWLFRQCCLRLTSENASPYSPEPSFAVFEAPDFRLRVRPQDRGRVPAEQPRGQAQDLQHGAHAQAQEEAEGAVGRD